MPYEDLPKRWQQKLQDFLTKKISLATTKLGASDFASDTTIRIEFEDDSKIEFRYSFIIEAPDFKELAVFTEHCGYHIFPL